MALQHFLSSPPTLLPSLSILPSLYSKNMWGSFYPTATGLGTGGSNAKVPALREPPIQSGVHTSHLMSSKSFDRGKQRMAWPLGSAEQEAQPSHERGWVRLGISELMKSKLCPGRIAEGSQVLAERRDGGSVSMCPEVCVSGTWKRKYKWLLKTGSEGRLQF